MQPKRWSDENEIPDADAPETFRKSTMLSQHISYLKDFFRSYKDFSDAHIDALEILVTKLYNNFGINDYTDFSKVKNTDYPIMEDLYALAEEEFNKYEAGSKSLFTEELLREICLGINSMCKVRRVSSSTDTPTSPMISLSASVSRDSWTATRS